MPNELELSQTEKKPESAQPYMQLTGMQYRKYHFCGIKMRTIGLIYTIQDTGMPDHANLEQFNAWRKITAVSNSIPRVI